MNILIITSAPPGSRAGNRATAERWAVLLEGAGHQVSVETAFEDQSCDLVLALHAWRSHGEILKIRHLSPDMPLVVALTGTDIYDHQHRYPDATLESMDLADSLVGLHRLAGQAIPEPFRDKLVTVLQSAPEPTASCVNTTYGTDGEPFLVSVIGHLRDEKDSLRTALAARKLPPESRIRVVAAGRAHNQQWAAMAQQEEAENERFQWLGELNGQATMNLLLGSRLMVISSVMEGGANVVSEACRAGIPVIASDIPGNLGLLGTEYPGYFPVRDEQALADLLLRAEREPEFLASLQARVAALAASFTPKREQASLLRAIDLALERTTLSG